MRETLWIALSSFRETVRDKILYTLLFFVLLLLGFSVLLGDWSVFAQKKVITDFSLGVMSLGGLAIAIFIGVGLVQKEIQRKTILTLLSKPVRRWQFLVGKYLGLLLVLVVNVLVMMAGLWAALAISGNSFDPRLWLAAYGVFLEMAVITSVALLFSSFSTPVVSSLLTFAVFLASHLSGGILEYIETMKRNASRIPGAEPLPAWFEATAKVVRRALPDLELFNIRPEIVHGLPLDPSHLPWATVHAVGWIVAILAVGSWWFDRRDFL